MTLGSPVPPALLASLLGRIGREPPARVGFVGGHGRCASWRLEFAAGEPLALWVEVADGVRGPPLALASAAGRWWSLLDGRPATELVSTRIDGRGLSIRPWTAAGVPWPEVARVLGATLDALQDGPDTGFATGVSGGRFVPVRGAWADEWLAVAEALYGRAVALGTDLGPLGRALLGAVRDAAPALRRARRFGLVHGGLGPDAVAVGPDGPVVVGWEDASLGDRLVDLAPLVALGPAALGEVLAASETHEPVDAERLDAYHRTWCLAQAVLVGEAAALDGTARLTALDRVARHARRALEPGFSEGALARAAAVAPGPPEGASIDRVGALLRVVLAEVATVEPPAPLAVAATLGALLLADEAGESERDALLGPLVVARPGPARWHADRAAGPLPELAVRGVAGLLQLTARAALRRVDFEVSDATLRGLERSIRAAAEAERVEGAGLSPLLGALVDLAVAADPRPDALLDAARDLDPTVALEAWDGVERFADAAGGDAGPLVAWVLRGLRGRVALPGGEGFVLRHGRSG